MAKVDWKYLRKRYGALSRSSLVKNATYQGIITHILAHHTENIQRGAVREVAAKIGKLSTRGGLKVPAVADVVFPQRLALLKAADRGKLITEGLRDRLSKELRATMTEGKAFFYTSGPRKGQVREGMIEDFQRRAAGVFAGYTKAGPAGARGRAALHAEAGYVPANIRAIAITEIRTNASEIKRAYIDRVKTDNPGVRILKTWRHKPSGIIKPRPAHVALDGITLPVDSPFRYVTEDGRQFNCQRPHDPVLPADQVIACSCDIDYTVEKD